MSAAPVPPAPAHVAPRPADVRPAEPSAARAAAQPWWDEPTHVPPPPRRMLRAPIVASPTRSRGSRLAWLWLLAVPGAAAAGWPLVRGDADAARSRAAELSVPTVADGQVLPVRHAVSSGESTPGVIPDRRAERASDAAGVADDARPAARAPIVALPHVELPAADVSQAAPALVRPEEFTTRIKVPGAP
jgi:hypothetical protein